MAKAEKTAVVPSVRFPEFRDEWKEIRVGDFFDLSAKAERAESFDRSRLLTVKLHCNGVVKNERVTLSGGANYFIRNAGQFIFSKIDLLNGAFGIVPDCLDGFSSSSDVPGYSFRSDQSPTFFVTWLRSHYKRLAIERTGTSSTLKRVSPEKFLALALFVPSPPEQRKIADCLSSLDELIAAQERKVEALKTYKRGLMQQLFPREGETRPRLRFPEFANTGAWHTQKMASLLSKASFAVSVDPEETYREIGIRSHGKGIFHKEPVLGKVIGDKRVFEVVQDALVLNIVFAWEQAVATTSENEIGMVASHRFPMYVAKPGMCDVEYVKGFFLTKEGKRLLGVASPGGAGRNKTLGQKDFENLEIALPVSVNEQTRIANCLSSCDAAITIESDKLESLKAHKKGLMQQLFPSLKAA